MNNNKILADVLLARLRGRVSRAIGGLILLFAALAAGTSVAAVDEASVRLSQFASKPGPLMLQGAAAARDLYIPLSPAVDMREATVELKFSNSIALVSGRSTLAVRLNDLTLAQIPLDPKQPVGTARVRLPAERWKPGYNKLSFAVVQHVLDRCEFPGLAELWTELDLHGSQLHYRVEDRDRALLLKDVGALFSPGIGGLAQVRLLTVEGSAAPVVSRALPRVAQALALRRQFAPLAIEHASVPAGAAQLPESPAQGAQVLVGTVDELRPLLPAAMLSDINGPHLAIERQARAAAASASLLVVTGNSADEVASAASLLAVMDDALNPVPRVTQLGGERRTPGLAQLSGRVLGADRRYTFATLGFADAAFRGAGAHTARLNLQVPADYYPEESAEVELLVDLAYGAGMGPGSVMNVTVNDRFVHGRPLEDKNGVAYRDYRIVLPARALVPGVNTVRFDFSLRPEVASGECVSVDGDHLVAQIGGSSRIVMPPFASAALQPDLGLLRTTGYPYFSTDGKLEPRLVVSSAAEVGSALTLLGKLAQVAGAPQEGWMLQVGMDGDKLAGRALLLAPAAQLPDDLFASWSAALGRSVSWPYQALNDMRDEGRAATHGFFSVLMDALLQGKASGQAPAMRGRVQQDGGLGDLGGIAALRNPRSADAATLTVIAAADAERLAARVQDLVRPEVWSRLGGDLAVWGGADDAVTTLRVAEPFTAGEQGRWTQLRLYLTANPWYVLLALLAGVVLVVVSARVLLRGRRGRIERGE
ncbi:cellulose biosynthesis cyclic di-GMP-binding regulatory protein BcsB [Thauera sp. 2A1]|uniref:cellulose biosynthesis cyclic di-GMP-binding regulatory protein BcsB n=1 Tax=Thauera sp. 2A1 TaxID=2570191 RepID=UPI0018857362|nr:cellulose biosynthesis cyclic di-GMP-binding regulatory protein BcsB [Thauera sp. 2A1]KAI5916038.1 cellulose biosynthesis cyclic di-GMP-binding regulatory protein BcsB [Thauera sp. 2A1]